MFKFNVCYETANKTMKFQQTQNRNLNYYSLLPSACRGSKLCSSPNERQVLHLEPRVNCECSWLLPTLIELMIVSVVAFGCFHCFKRERQMAQFSYQFCSSTLANSCFREKKFIRKQRLQSPRFCGFCLPKIIFISYKHQEASFGISELCNSSHLRLCFEGGARKAIQFIR